MSKNHNLLIAIEAVLAADLCSDIAPPLHELEEIEETMVMLDKLEDEDGSQ